jgi:hypothetical protein
MGNVKNFLGKFKKALAKQTAMVYNIPCLEA